MGRSGGRLDDPPATNARRRILQKRRRSIPRLTQNEQPKTISRAGRKSNSLSHTERVRRSKKTCFRDFFSALIKCPTNDDDSAACDSLKEGSAIIARSLYVITQKTI